MYEAKTITVSQYLDDPFLKYPRFQRKRSWAQDKTFNLALTLYRGYPPGLVVVRRDTDETGRPVHFLLDGRQRREAFGDMRDPEQLWIWAKAVLKFKNSDSENEIYSKFLVHLERFFGVEDWETDAESGAFPEADAEDNLEAGPEEPLEVTTEEGGSPPSAVSGGAHELNADSRVAVERSVGPLGGLKQLLELLLLVHPVKVTSSGVRRSKLADYWDFSAQLTGLSYMKLDAHSRRAHVSSPRLVTWIKNRREVAQAERAQWPPQTSDDLANHMLEQGNLIGGDDTQRAASERSFREALSLRWDRISATLRLIDDMHDRMARCDMGYIEITECSPNDEKKIFEIINTAGTRLTAAEILSAKWSWNVEVTDPVEEIFTQARKLFESMQIDFDGTVRRWDVAATLVQRLEADLVLGDLS
jgi:hypothetical protein